MTDQMHDGKCNELLVREETIHRRGPAKSCIRSQFTPISAVFKVSNFFFLHYYWLLREQLFPSLLLFRITILTLTDRQLMGGKLDCVHEEIQFSDETNALHRGEFVAALREAGPGSRFKRGLGSAWTGSG